MKLEIDDENEFLTGIAGEISLIKNERVELEHYFSKNCSEEVFRKIYEGYEERKKRARLIDFDDMLVYTWELLTITKFKGIDPEMMSGVGYAPMRQYAFGVNVTF